MKKHDIGLIGLAVMGSNLALNMADKGFNVAIYNRTYAVGQRVIMENPHNNLTLYEHLKDFVLNLSKPRKIILMVKAGNAVDYVINDLIPLLDKDDIIIDGGNSKFQDTILRSNRLKEQNLNFLGVGISGGEEGARFGPAIMPGGNSDAYEYVRPIFEEIAAKYQGEPCVSYIGENGAGHFVKTVHNGIEYADMQLIAESYSLLKHLAGFSNQELSKTFNEWNKGELESFLIEITGKIFETKDLDTKNDLIDMILDKAAQKGTGKWTTEEALNTGTDASLLTSAVYARFMSANKDERVIASNILSYERPNDLIEDKNSFAEKIREALYASKIIAYAQGFDLMKRASNEYNWNLKYGSIAKIFREGCIIRARFLNRITDAYENNPELLNLLLDETFKNILHKYQNSLREVVSLAVMAGVSIPAFSAAISYFDAYRTKDSNANLIQAQRDLFGAHTFERIDKKGSFHHEW